MIELQIKKKNVIIETFSAKNLKVKHFKIIVYFLVKTIFNR